MVGNVSAVAMPMMTRTITSSRRVKPAARGGGCGMPGPFAPMQRGYLSPHLHRARPLGFASRRHRRVALWDGATKGGGGKNTAHVAEGGEGNARKAYKYRLMHQ